MNQKKIFVVMPAYNEEKKISSALRNLKNNGFDKIVVVDDGSEDKTYSLAQEEKVMALRHIINCGQGAALRTGIDYALDQGAEIIVTFDADGQHQVEDIGPLVKPILRQRADVVLGSRFLSKKSNVPWLRKMFLKGGVFSFWLLYGARVTDAHNGLRAFSRKAARKIQIQSSGMEHASEIVEEICKKRLKYQEVSVTIKYTDYSKKHGQSTLNGLNILFKMLIKNFLR